MINDPLKGMVYSLARQLSRRRTELQQGLLDNVEKLSDERLGIAAKLVEAVVLSVSGDVQNIES
jgi:hypothetical protein